jgi:hypothetical protein
VPEPPKQTGFLSNILPFNPWRRKAHGQASPKVGTSTETQKINAHGYFPSFDGAGDGNTKDTRPLTKDQTADASKGKNGPAAQKGGQWVPKESHKLPPAMDVRAFFQLLRQEDKEILNRYNRESRPFG